MKISSSIKYFIFLFYIASSFSVSAQKPTTALQMNDYLAAITDSIYSKGGQWGTALNNAIKNDDNTKMIACRKNIERFIADKITDVKNLKDIYGSEDLRQAMLRFLYYEQSLISKAFTPYESINSSTTQDELDAMNDHLKELAADEETYLSKVRKEQTAYARKNDFSIED